MNTLQKLLSDSTLKQQLIDNPMLVNQQDGNGKTLLHHACSLNAVTEEQSVDLLNNLKVLFDSPIIDLNIKDNAKNTFLHTAANNCEDEVYCRCIFPYLINKAAAQQFDFNIPGQLGLSIIHLIANIGISKVMSEDSGLKANYLLSILLAQAVGINVNCLSSEGTTALYSAIYLLNTDLIVSLLHAGADPLIGAINKKPLDLINTQWANWQAQRSALDPDPVFSVITSKLTATKALIQKATANAMEIRKNACVLKQLGRQSFFSSEILVNIASQTGDVQLKKNSSYLAYNYLSHL